MLAKSLQQFSEECIKSLEKHEADGKRIKTKVLKVRPVFEQFNYNEGNISHTCSIEYVEREEWHIADQFKLIQEVIKGLGSYNNCLIEIVSTYDLEEKVVDNKLTKLIQHLTYKYFEDGAKFSLIDLITRFIQDLDNSPIIWSVKGALIGVVLKDAFIELNSFILRQPTPDDFIIEESLDSLALGMPTSSMSIHTAIPTTFIEFKNRASDENEVYRKYQCFIDLLRLFRLGSVISISFTHTPESVLRGGGWQSPNTNYGPNYRYTLSANDIGSLNEFISQNEKHVKRVEQSQADQKSGRSISVAYRRFQDALLDKGPLESRISSTITCLESLLLKATERAELSHRLSQRLSALIKHHDYKPVKVYGEVQRAYDIRSTYIHGSELETDKKKGLNDLAKVIMDYARIAVLTFLQLDETMEKDKIINKLDNALIDENASNKWNKEVMQLIKIPK